MFIEPTTAVATQAITVNANTTFQTAGTLVAETIDFEQPDGAGGWIPVVLDTTTQQLTATNTMVTFFGPASIRVNKPITANSVGVLVAG